jgi:hypothetical protein
VATTFPVRAETQPAIKDIDQLIAALRKTGKEAGMTEKEIDDLVKKSSSFGKEGAKSVNDINKGMTGLSGTLKTVGAGMIGLFAVDRLKAFLGSVVDITSQFQRLEAVLTNTLGSSSAARAAMKDLSDFAAKTPFSLITLTENFVKLANRGVKPTMDQMRGLGDLSATLGKDVGQLVEALLDVNNPERWKELGIVSQTAGDKVKLSFRGVTYEADRTVEGVTKAAVALGNLEGVAGSMAAISETLGGKISNLGDAWDQFLATVGDGNKGILSGAVSLLTDAINKAKELVQTDSQKREQDQLSVYSEQKKVVEELFALTQDLDKAREMALQKLYAQLELINKQIKTGDDLIEERNNVPFGEKADPTLVASAFRAATVRNELINRYNDLVNDGQKAILEYTNEVKKKQDTEDSAAAVKNEEARIKRAKELKDIYRELLALTQKFNDESLAAFNKSLQVNPNDVLGVLDPARGVIPGVNADALVDPEKADEFAIKSVADIEQEKQDLRQQTFDHAVGLVNSYAQLQEDQVQNELQWMRYRYNEELALAGDNENAKDKIRNDFAKKETALRNKQMQIQNQQALFNILVSQGPAVAKTIGEVGFPAAIALLFLVAAQFGLLLKNQQKIQPPRFKDGVYGLDGPGNETSDSIPAWLSRNESVVPADRSKHFKDLLKPMIEGESFSWADVKKVVDGKLPGLAAPIIITGQGGTDSSELASEMRATRKAIENKKETHFVFDEKGFGAWIQNGNDVTKVLRKRYSM